MTRPAVRRQPAGWTAIAAGIGAVVVMSAGIALVALAVCAVAAAALG